jgi:hypothetical protein
MEKTKTAVVAPGYYERLREAFDAMDAVDMFDLYSENPDSVAKWEELLRDSATAQLKLIVYVSMHRDELLRETARK